MVSLVRVMLRSWGSVVSTSCVHHYVVTEGVHQLVDQVEDGHLERDPALLLGLHADEQTVEAVGLTVHAVSVIYTII